MFPYAITLSYQGLFLSSIVDELSDSSNSIQKTYQRAIALKTTRKFLSITTNIIHRHRFLKIFKPVMQKSDEILVIITDNYTLIVSQFIEYCTEYINTIISLVRTKHFVTFEQFPIAEWLKLKMTDNGW